MQQVLGTQDVCFIAADLQSTLKADSVTVGTMFSVRSHNAPLTIRTMEISVNPLVGLPIEVYTRLGGYTGHERDESEWQKIVDTRLTSIYHEERGALIPEKDFVKIEMGSDEVRSFYVTLQSPDLRYIRAQEGLVTPTSDGYLTIAPGVGLNDYKFQSSFLSEGRLFSGMVRYSRAAECQFPRTQTHVTYGVHVVRGSQRTDELVETIKQSMTSAVEMVLSNEMKDFVQQASLTMDDMDLTALQQYPGEKKESLFF